MEEEGEVDLVIVAVVEVGEVVEVKALIACAQIVEG